MSEVDVTEIAGEGGAFTKLNTPLIVIPGPLNFVLKAVLELDCGFGQGVDVLKNSAKSYIEFDFCTELVGKIRASKLVRKIGRMALSLDLIYAIDVMKEINALFVHRNARFAEVGVSEAALINNTSNAFWLTKVFFYE